MQNLKFWLRLGFGIGLGLGLGRVMNKGEKSENRTKFEILVKYQNYLKNKILRYPKNSFNHLNAYKCIL